MSSMSGCILLLNQQAAIPRLASRYREETLGVLTYNEAILVVITEWISFLCINIHYDKVISLNIFEYLTRSTTLY